MVAHVACVGEAEFQYMPGVRATLLYFRQHTGQQRWSSRSCVEVANQQKLTKPNYLFPDCLVARLTMLLRDAT